jgi:hypothetical protein
MMTLLVSIKLTTLNQGSMVQRMDWTGALPDVEGSRVFGKRVNQAGNLPRNSIVTILKDIRKANDFETVHVSTNGTDLAPRGTYFWQKPAAAKR